MKKFFTNKITLTIIGIILFLIIWELISLIIGERTLIFPGPIETFKYLFIILGESYIYSCILSSFIKMIIGFIISIVIALILGTIASQNDKLEKIFQPTITAIKAIPTASLVFLFLVLVGAKNTPVAIVILISFPVIYESVVGGYKNINNEILQALSLEKCSIFKKIFKIKLPLAIPYIIVGISSSFALSFKIEIMAEIISGDTKKGIGSAILAAQKNDPSNLVPIFAYSIIAIILMLIVSFISKQIKSKLIKTV